MTTQTHLLVLRHLDELLDAYEVHEVTAEDTVELFFDFGVDRHAFPKKCSLAAGTQVEPCRR